MKILGFNLSLSRQSTVPPPPDVPLSDFGAAWLHGEDLNCPVLSNAYQQVVWVYRAINVLAEQIANIPFLFSRGERGRENLITSGPLHDFYNRPHPQINRFQYWELRIIWLMLRGETIRIPIFHDPASRITNHESRITPHASRITNHESRKLKSILILDPSRFHHIIQANQLLGWRYTGFGPNTPLASQVFLPEEVWHEKLPNPFDFWRGMSPLGVAQTASRTDFAAASFMNGLMENNADVGLIVRTDQDLSLEQRAQVLAELRSRKRHAGVADRPLLLWGGAEVVRPELSSAELQFLENRKFSRAEIFAAFGVPEEIVTTTDTAKFDVMAGSRLNFIENRVAPLCARLEAEEQATVHAIDPTATGWFDLDSMPIMQEARRTRLTIAKTAFEMGVPFNELNRVLDLGFLPLTSGNISYLPANMHKISEEPPPPKPQKSKTDNPPASAPISLAPFEHAIELLTPKPNPAKPL